MEPTDNDWVDQDDQQQRGAVQIREIDIWVRGQTLKFQIMIWNLSELGGEFCTELGNGA